MEVDVTRPSSSLASELYFLVVKFLGDGPCRAVADALKLELERAKILPQRLDWLGNEHNQSFEELERKYSHIGPNHLLQICARIGPVLEKEVPPCVAGAVSLLGVGKQSLLRTKEDMLRFIRSVSVFSARYGGKPLMTPPGDHIPLNIVRVLQGRENSGPLTRREAVPASMFKNVKLYRHTLGHLSAVYCALFDRTGKYIITGADDLLVKVWSSTDGRLLATFRGASAEIMDIAVNFDNTLLAAGSLDKIIRVWCFLTMSPIAVLSGHAGHITSVNFCPISCNGVYYLVSTSNDGSVAFWSHTKKRKERAVFQTKPIQYHEKMRPGQAQMVCASISPGGTFVAAGSADHHVRVYLMPGVEGPKRILEVEAHSDTVDSIQWAHSGLRFISGSKDGTANIWNFEQQEWKSKILVMHTKLAGVTTSEEDSNKKTKVTMVCWDCSDEWVMTAVNDNTLKIWNSKTAELKNVLRGHKDDVYVLESHPIDPRVILSAGHDGQVMIWDVLSSEPLASFNNFIEGQGHGAIYDAKWSPDGTMFAATDSHGHLMIYGFGSNDQRLKLIPKELFFHTDYRPLIRDSNHYVLDEQTQTAPHLMPPPFLVDVDGNPYPPALQRLVPGRETCKSDELVPNIAVGASGQQEVIEGLPRNENGEAEQPRSNIDRLIEDLAHNIENLENNPDRANNQNMNVDIEGDGDNNEEEEEQQPMEEIASPRANRPAIRRVGNLEGVRQSRGNWQRDNTTPWHKPLLARPLNPALLHTMRQQVRSTADAEHDCYKRELHRKPQASATTAQDQNKALAKNKKSRTARHGYRTRATRDDEEREEDDFDDGENSEESRSSNESSSAEDMSSGSSSSESSSEYSDWLADAGVNLEPPKRSKRKPVQKRPDTPPSDSDRRRSQRPKKKAQPPIPDDYSSVTEVPEIYRPPEWLSEHIPRKTPYYPQMGDEVVYFRQGHNKYLETVKSRNIYNINHSFEPWTKLDLKAQEFVKIIGIKYEIKPPRLCCLKLAQMNQEGHLTGKSFTIKYHDIPNVLDFLVLRQTFDNALERSWSEGNRFRCMIDLGWWEGQIISVQPQDEEFPDSYFMCFKIKWDSGETEFMSPWDLEPIDESRSPAEMGGVVPVLQEEIQEMLYQPVPEEWPNGDRDTACDLIIRGLDQVMTLAIAEPFNVPVDLTLYPSYAYVVEYPIDLTTIKARFENRFYRRITSAQFDVRYMATNAEKFNEKGSQIIKRARIITEICLKIIKEATEHDVTALYHQFTDAYRSSDSDVDVEDEEVDINRPSTSSQRPTRAAKRTSKATRKSHATQEISSDWRVACKQLLETLWLDPDSEPFRLPVDRLAHPEYYDVIDTPIDLQTIKEDLSGGNHEAPTEFAKDLKLLFTNSRTFNTNQRSKIYAMTTRLSDIYDEIMPRIIYKWKSASKSKDGRSSRKTSKKGSPTKNKMGNGSNKRSPVKKRQISSDDEEDEEVDVRDEEEDVDVEDEDDDEEEERPGPSKLANGYSKRLAAKSKARPALRPRNIAKRKRDDSDDETEEEEAEESSQNMTESSDEERPLRRTRSGRPTTMVNGHSDSDSDEIYEPTSYKGKQTRTNRAKNSRRAKRRVVKSEEVDEDEEEEEEEEEEEQTEAQEAEDGHEQYEGEETDESEEVVTRNTGRRPRAAAAKNKIQDSSSEEEEDEKAEQDDGNIEYREGEEDEEGNEEIQAEEEHQEDGGDDDEEDDEGEQNSEEDDDDDDDDDNDSTENNQVLSNMNYGRGGARRPRISRDSESSGGPTKHNLRRLNTKRKRYIEEDSDGCDDDDYTEDSRGSSSKAAKTRRTVKRPYYGEEASDDESSNAGNNDRDKKKLGITVSSRGRVRKMTQKAMSALR